MILSFHRLNLASIHYTPFIIDVAFLQLEISNLEAVRLKITDFYTNCSVRYVEKTELQAFSDLSKAL